jgi:CubicO group peptidase (beta-lactamase class C family)
MQKFILQIDPTVERVWRENRCLTESTIALYRMWVRLDASKAGTLRGEGSYNWSGAAGTWFWIDPKNDLIFIGMIQVMNRWQDPQLHNIDAETAALVYGALVNPAK